MGQTLTGLLTSVRAIAGRPGSPAPGRTGGGPDPALLAALRHCGDHLAALAASGPLTDARRTRLIASIGALTTACSTPGAGAFDALLRTGQQALDSGGEAGARLALALADEATALRGRSKGAWRLRGNALDALGLREEAITAYERHLALQQNAAASRDVERRIATLRAAGDRIDEALALVGDADGAGDGTGGGAGVGAGVGTGAVRLSPPAARRRGPRRLHRAGPPPYRRTRGRRPGRTPSSPRSTPNTAGSRTTTRWPTRSSAGPSPSACPVCAKLVAGRTVCLVADTPRTAEQEQRPGSSLAALIEGYDLVVRCDAPRHAAPTARTDLHVCTLRGDTPWKGPRWDRRAGTRLVFGDPLPHWRLALRSRLVPGAQDRIGDASLRRPLHDPALIGGTADGEGPASTAYTVLRLLDFLGTPARVDLIGFEGPAALSPREREWIGARTGTTDDTAVRITLR
ncbi:tetratricopeptide repeat protein [Streptomyces sp. JUS-F4]|uniref:tetratricopeptide repeat protein n=1 Tax=Streptomyces sp. JUS-F4 TaxID=2951988 RepID=UPI002665AEA1|nr:tetratricopeptide repeat protein [Streptomyces sp. JUS-F4]WKN16938.1 tetratricopeptide repeat protein [Streptomyces sp. JUS-F4]